MRQFRTEGATLALAMALTLAFASCGARAPAATAGQAAAARKPTIGLVFDIGGRDDDSFNRSAYDGLVELARKAGGRIQGDPEADFGSALDIRVLESMHAGADREQLLRSLAEEGRDLVIAVGFLFADSISSVSRDYPRTHFVLLDGVVPDLKPDSPITCVSFAEHEASFVAGACAGKLALAIGPDSRVGFVGGMDTPQIRRFLSGYSAGAALVNPSLRASGRVLSAFVARDASGFDDPKRAGELASVLYQAGSAVIFHAAGGSGRGVFEAAARLGTKAIGVDSDQGALLAASADPSGVLLSRVVVTSVLKRLDEAVRSLGEELLAGTPIVGGYRTLGLAEGGVDYVARGLPDDIAATLSDLSLRVATGEIVVPADEQALSDFIAMLR